jgi:hypothetical protein
MQFVLSSLWQAAVFTVLVCFAFSQINQVFGQTMSSGSFQLSSDSINFGGGLSSSTDFQMESTMGEIATGQSSSDTFSLRAGYQQMQEVYLSLTATSSITLQPSLPGLTGGTSTGAFDAFVITDSPAGYQLLIEAENSPAMQSGANSIANYIPAGSAPDFLFVTDPIDSHFGFTAEGPHAALAFQDASSACGVSGVSTPERCWTGLTTTPVVIASSLTSNHPTGATTTVRFQVGIGGSVVVAPGEYVATTTITAIAQ